jgi:hypothetical protein
MNDKYFTCMLSQEQKCLRLDSAPSVPSPAIWKMFAGSQELIMVFDVSNNSFYPKYGG